MDKNSENLRELNPISFINFFDFSLFDDLGAAFRKRQAEGRAIPGSASLRFFAAQEQARQRNQALYIPGAACSGMKRKSA